MNNPGILYLGITAILSVGFGLGVTLHKGLAERFVGRSFRGKLWRRILGDEDRAIAVVRRFAGPLMFLIGIWAGANALLLALGAA